jgi:hypothetical protein
VIDLTRREFLALSAALAALPDLPRRGSFVVHEWGVITIPYGTPYATIRSAGIQGVDQAPDLPAHAVTWRKVVGDAIERWKNEPVEFSKPIVYFYPPKAMAVNVRLSVPAGRPSAWWPATTDYGPKPIFPGRSGKQRGEPAPPNPDDIQPKDGFLQWTGLALDPTGDGFPDAPAWWKRARDVDAAVVLFNNQKDKFLYYDALGNYAPKLAASWTKEGVTLRNDSPDAFSSVMAVRVKNGVCFSATAPLAKGASADLKLAKGLPDLAAALAGLYKKEAAALVEIWNEEFFKTEGVRLLAVLARDAYDRLLPIEITPKPDELERVLILHLECVDNDRAAQIRGWIEELASSDIEARDRAATQLRRLGPLAEPILRQTHDKTTDAEVKARIAELLPRQK